MPCLGGNVHQKEHSPSRLDIAHVLWLKGNRRRSDTHLNLPLRRAKGLAQLEQSYRDANSEKLSRSISRVAVLGTKLLTEQIIGRVHNAVKGKIG